ncbi:MAG: type III pantothenate kinase [Eubacteriales bacterium]
MLLAIDIGNTNIVIGVIEEEKVLFDARMATDHLKTSDQYGVEIGNILALHHCKREDITHCIISSVVPPVFHSVHSGMKKLTCVEPLVVGHGIELGVNIAMDDPKSVGSDLIVAAVAAIDRYPQPIILVDMGTATTVTVIGQNNSFLGGCIIPGVRVAADALSSRAAQLPGIQLDNPKQIIGKNTIDCMRSGIMYSAAAAIDGIVERMEDDLGEKATVVVTGGIAPIILPLCKREMILERDLLLKGLQILHKKNIT